MDRDHLQKRAEWLEAAVRLWYPPEIRSDQRVAGEREYFRMIDHYGEQLLDRIELQLTPAMRRMLELNAGTYMHRSVRGLTDCPYLEVGFGGTGRYEFSVGGFCWPVLAVLDVRVTPCHLEDLTLRPSMRWPMGGLFDYMPEPRWLHVPEQAWHQAGVRPETVDYRRLRPLEPVLDQLLDSVVRRAIEAQVRFRKQYDFPLEEESAAEFRRRRGVA